MKYLTVKELATFLNISEGTIYDWVEKNKIPHYKIHRLVRFDEDEIYKWLKTLKRKNIRGFNYYTGLDWSDPAIILAPRINKILQGGIR